MLAREREISYRTFGLELLCCQCFINSGPCTPVNISRLMKPSFVIMLVLSIASISTASVLFLDAPPRYAAQKPTVPSSVEIKWGEGSEVGVPSSAVNKWSSAFMYVSIALIQWLKSRVESSRVCAELEYWVWRSIEYERVMCLPWQSWLVFHR